VVPDVVPVEISVLSLDRQQIDLLGEFWSEWQDLNLRPPRPERGALPDCATLRYSWRGLIALALQGRKRGYRQRGRTE
jgi:hypothetical protein